MEYIKETESGDSVFSINQGEIVAIMNSILYMDSQVKENFVISKVGFNKEKIWTFWEDLDEKLQLLEPSEEEDLEESLSADIIEIDKEYGEIVLILSDEKIAVIYKSFVEMINYIDDWEYGALIGIEPNEALEIKEEFEQELEKRAHARQQFSQ